MKFRKSVESDIHNIMSIIQQAQEYFNQNGINQWQNHYPNFETIGNDISKGYGYVLQKGQSIIGTVAVSFDGDKNYDSIFGGEWIGSHNYAVIHRIAIDDRYKGCGYSSEMIKNIEKICLKRGVHSIKVDTHKANVSMQRLLQKNGFQYCGIIYLEDQSERIAFEKLL